MAKYRKLGRTSSQRKALIRNQVTALLNNGKIVTTEAKAKEIRKEVEKLIALAVKEKDNFEEVTVKAKVAKKDDKGRRVKEVVDGKKVTVYEEVEKTIKKDMPSRLHARRQMLKVLYPVKDVPTEAAGRKNDYAEGTIQGGSRIMMQMNIERVINATGSLLIWLVMILAAVILVGLIVIAVNAIGQGIKEMDRKGEKKDNC